jgi:hypothetical protein
VLLRHDFAGRRSPISLRPKRSSRALTLVLAGKQFRDFVSHPFAAVWSVTRTEVKTAAKDRAVNFMSIVLCYSD